MKNHLSSLFLIGIILSCSYKKPDLKNPVIDVKSPAKDVKYTANERTQIFQDQYVSTPDTSFQHD